MAGRNIFNLSSSAKTYLDVLRALPIYLADGLLIGLIVGVGQVLVLRRFTNSSSAWVLATWFALGMGMFVPAFTHGNLFANFEMGVRGQ